MKKPRDHTFYCDNCGAVFTITTDGLIPKTTCLDCSREVHKLTTLRSNCVPEWLPAYLWNKHKHKPANALPSSLWSQPPGDEWSVLPIETLGKDKAAGLQRLREFGVEHKLVGEQLTYRIRLEHRTSPRQTHVTELRQLWSQYLEAPRMSLEEFVTTLPHYFGQEYWPLLSATTRHLCSMEVWLILQHLYSRGATPPYGYTWAELLGVEPAIAEWLAGGRLTTPHHASKMQKYLRHSSVPRGTPFTRAAAQLARTFRQELRGAWRQAHLGEELLPVTPGTDKPLEQALLSCGYRGWRSQEQRNGARAILDGRDCVIVIPTGGGKTLCYEVAAQALVEQGYTLVVSPLLALMEDQARRIEGAVWFQAGLQEEDYRDLFEQLYERGIGFISPELLQSRTFKRLFEQEHPPTRLVIDEAHCVVRWGESFRPDYIQLGEFRRWLEESTGYDVPLATLTATLTEEEQAQLIEILSLRSPVCIRANPMRPELLYETRVIKSEKARYRELLKHLRDTPHTTGIVYVAFATGERHHSAQHLAEELNAQGFDVEPYYSRMSDARKKEVVQRLRARELQAIIATSAFGMGIDIPCMDWVIHLHPPTNLSEYYQGAGRAGRGMDHRIEQARCILMGHHNDWNMLKQHLYLSLLREDTLRDKLARFSDPHSATISGVHFDANKGVLMINPQMAPGHASHMLFAQRHGALERCASTSLPDGWLGWRLPATEDALLHFRKEREALKEEVNRHWMNMMQYLESDSPM